MTKLWVQMSDQIFKKLDHHLKFNRAFTFHRKSKK